MATSTKGLFLNQRKYLLDLLQEVDMSESKPRAIPLDCKFQMNAVGESLPNIHEYQRLVGKLIYIIITRLDITFAVRIISHFMHAPTESHMLIVKKVLRYLKGSVSGGILMRKNCHNNIVGFTDADWAGNKLDRKSTTGFCTLVGGNLVTWKSKKTAHDCLLKCRNRVQSNSLNFL
ncbi:PREDICTED: uncharacterized mitochondrial protein AtMg00810-like [Fragaria vesca subsp. vesca]